MSATTSAVGYPSDS